MNNLIFFGRLYGQNSCKLGQLAFKRIVISIDNYKLGSNCINAWLNLTIVIILNPNAFG